MAKEYTERWLPYADPSNDTWAQPDHYIWCEALLLPQRSCTCGFDKWLERRKQAKRGDG